MNLNTIKIEDSDCFWDNLFDDEEISEIIRFCESVPKMDGVIGTDSSGIAKLNKDIRNSHVSWIYRNEENNWFFQKIQIRK